MAGAFSTYKHLSTPGTKGFFLKLYRRQALGAYKQAGVQQLPFTTYTMRRKTDIFDILQHKIRTFSQHLIFLENIELQTFLMVVWQAL